MGKSFSMEVQKSSNQDLNGGLILKHGSASYSPCDCQFKADK